MEKEGVGGKRHIFHQARLVVGNLTHQVQKSPSRDTGSTVRNDEAIKRSLLAVAVFAELSQLHGAVNQLDVARSRELIFPTPIKRHGRFPTGGKIEFHRCRPAALAGQGKQDHGQIQVSALAVHTARKDAVPVGVKLVAEGEFRTGPSPYAPGLLVELVQAARLRATGCPQAANMLNEIPNLVGAVPGGKLNGCARCGLFEGHRDVNQVACRLTNLQ